MLHRSTPRRATGLTFALFASVLAALTVLVGPSSGASERALATVTVDTLPIANGFPLDLGIQKGFFEKRGIEIKKVTFQSGNDIVLAISNNNGDIGYIGWTPAFIAQHVGNRHRRRRRPARSKERSSPTTGRTSWSRGRARSVRRRTLRARPSPSTRSRASARS